MMIDKHAISQSEHTGLFFEAANGTTFIGSPTMGANGDVTVLTLPGGHAISFGGHDVRHADGRQLQRVGLVPHIEGRPTIKGIQKAGTKYSSVPRCTCLKHAEVRKKKAAYPRSHRVGRMD